MSAESEVVAMVLDDTKEKMAKAVEHTSAELATIRTGRASPALVEKLKVEYYGTPTPLQQIAGIGTPEPRLLVISPYDKTSMKAIEKAIQESDLGINPQNDGAVIRLAIPPLSEERRKELAKQAKHKAEEGRIAIRNLRRQARHELDAFEKDGEVGVDEIERAERDLDKLTADQVVRVDEILHHKETDLLQV
jgi:ribosome recycling factor